MTPEEFAKLRIKPGTRILVVWLDAAEIRTRTFRRMEEDDVITVVETEGEFIEIYTSPNYPVPHLILYGGVRVEDGLHVHYSIPLPLVHKIIVLKRGQTVIKVRPGLYVIPHKDGEKIFVQEKHKD